MPQDPSIWDAQWEPVKAPRPPDVPTFEDEESFQKWYRQWASVTGISPDPDAPEHKYDYRAAYKSKAIPAYESSTQEWHWPSQFKAPDHPRRFVGGIDTTIGLPVKEMEQGVWAGDWAPLEREPESAVERIKGSWRTGKLQYELGQLRFNEIVGESTPEMQARIEEIKSQMPKGERERRTLIEEAVRAAAEMAPIPIGGMKKGAELGLKAAMVAGTAAAIGGQLGPQVALPEEVITVPAAAALGFKSGMLAGTLTDIGRIEAGLAYDELLELKDAQGNRLDPTITKAAAGGVGVINGLIELSQIKTFLRTIPGADKIVRTVIRKGVLEIIKKGALKNLALKSAAAYGYGVASETGQEILQESTNILATEMAARLNNELKGTNIPTQTRKEIVDRLVDTAEQSALAFSVFMFPGTAASTGMEAAQRRKPPAPSQAPPPVDVVTPEAETLSSRIIQDYNNGLLTTADLQELRPRVEPAVQKAIDKILNFSGATDEAIDLLRIKEPGLITEEGKEIQRRRDVETGKVPLTYGLQPKSAEESAAILQDHITQADRFSKSPAAQEALREKYGKEEQEERIRGLQGLSGYLYSILEMVETGEPGGRIRIKDEIGPGEDWVGFSSTYPEFMVNRYAKDETIKALKKGLAGHEFTEKDFRQGQIWDDALEYAKEMRQDSMDRYAALVEAEPWAIADIPDQEYHDIIREYRNAGYSTRAFENAATQYRGEIQSRAIQALAEEQGLTEEQLASIIETEEINLNQVWDEATNFPSLQEEDWYAQGLREHEEPILPGEERGLEPEAPARQYVEGYEPEAIEEREREGREDIQLTEEARAEPGYEVERLEEEKRPPLELKPTEPTPAEKKAIEKMKEREKAKEKTVDDLIRELESLRWNAHAKATRRHSHGTRVGTTKETVADKKEYDELYNEEIALRQGQIAKLERSIKRLGGEVPGDARAAITEKYLKESKDLAAAEEVLMNPSKYPARSNIFAVARGVFFDHDKDLPLVVPYMLQSKLPPKNVAKLLHAHGIEKKVLEGEDFHMKLKNEGYLDLVIESHPYPGIEFKDRTEFAGDRAIYITHYIEEGGDLIIDSEIVFRLIPHLGELQVMEIAGRGPMGEWRARYGYSDYSDAYKMATIFAKNIISQGFMKAEPVGKVKEEEAAPEKKPEYPAGVGPAHQIRNWIYQALKTNKKTDWRQLFKWADAAFGGTQAEGKYTPADAYDAMEVGVNRYIQGSLTTVA